MAGPSRLFPLVLGLLAALAAACAPPLQNGGVEVLPGAAERLEVFCRFRGAAAQGAEVCASSEGDLPDADRPPEGDPDEREGAPAPGPAPGPSGSPATPPPARR